MDVWCLCVRVCVRFSLFVCRQRPCDADHPSKESCRLSKI
jgi:hypothetical protein